jgi:hypothetical protein
MGIVLMVGVGVVWVGGKFASENFSNQPHNRQTAVE